MATTCITPTLRAGEIIGESGGALEIFLVWSHLTTSHHISPHVNKSGCEDHNVSQSDRTGTGTLLK